MTTLELSKCTIVVLHFYCPDDDDVNGWVSLKLYLMNLDFFLCVCLYIVVASSMFFIE